MPTKRGIQRTARRAASVAVLAGAAITAVVPTSASAQPASSGATETYVVAYGVDASTDSARASIADAGGTIVSENAEIGVAQVVSSNAAFVSELSDGAAIAGVAKNSSIGTAPSADTSKVSQTAAEKAMSDAGPLGAAAEPVAAAAGEEPLASLQWDMSMIGATAEGSYAVDPGSRQIWVGVIDTGIDATHPDLEDNFNWEMSRNFTVDIPLIDGPCEEEADHSCYDSEGVDEDGHGTHVAGTIAAAVNGLGTAGVAPNVRLVNLRAGQDSGYFFLYQTAEALTYAGNTGIDVVNMSFFVDPWLYNCTANPADSPEAQAEQQTIITVMNRALTYARSHGVTLVGALGNEDTDLGNPTIDEISPDYPPDAAYSRTIDNTCVDLPVEGPGVIGVSAVGPSGRKSFFSNYGTEQTDVSAPGGDSEDFFDTPQYGDVNHRILSTYPESVLRATGEIDENGEPTIDRVVKDCNATECAYYRYLQGTSMASPHAAGVAALIASHYVTVDHSRGPNWLNWWGADPDFVEQKLYDTATDTPCPAQSPYTYGGLPSTFDAVCTGDASFNGFYGNGVVNALAAVS